ncbi:P-loop NTPase [Calycomorphotria hydatis]|uniref:Flagellum site-determining protein YlxH n=1 Tax=Calycomorphotria hydatis TaxID=2528027 RepID=A0A517TEI0_9PLAN|nr:P-loop NTPase [Calycomorphotria hydatis]QDT66765.1 Flagellum site-determining protein YlxH [Calycomorphotria hydatis]
MDQATTLRDRMTDTQSEVVIDSSVRRAQVIAVTSGKGGVGKSNLVLNLAIALTRLKHRVCVLDANPGHGNIDLLCGENGYWNLSHYLSGAKSLDEISINGPEGLKIIPGVSAYHDFVNVPEEVQEKLVAALDELSSEYDFMLVDAGTGLHAEAKAILSEADRILLVSSPEPTSVADTYAMLKSLSGLSHSSVSLVINQSESPERAAKTVKRLEETARSFLQFDVNEHWVVPEDTAVKRAVQQQSPFLVNAPRCPASRAVQTIAERLLADAVRPQKTASQFWRAVLPVSSSRWAKSNSPTMTPEVVEAQA